MEEQDKKYYYKDKIIGVYQILGKLFMVGGLDRDSRHRVKTRALPLCITKEQAQIYLDAWAKEKGLREAEQ